MVRGCPPSEALLSVACTVAANRRILAAADPAVARMIEIALDSKTKHRDAIAAIRELMTRAEMIAQLYSAATDADNGVLWDEFMEVYNRRVGPDVPS